MREYIQSSLEHIESSFPSSAVIIAGDLNKLDLSSTVKVFQLKPVIDFPTRGANTLDQIHTNLSEYYSSPLSAPPFGLSDHLSIIMYKPHSRIIKVRDKRPSNVRAFGHYLLKIPWDNLFPIPSIDQKLFRMTNIINYRLNLIMPERSIKIHHNDRPWVNSSLKSLISRRQKALASGDVTLFKLLLNKVNRERKSCPSISCKLYYQTKVRNLHDNKLKDWWREVKQLCGTSLSRNRRNPLQ